MMLSVRWPAALPVPSFLRSAADRSERLSDPTTRMFVPDVSAVGCSARTRSIWFHAPHRSDDEEREQSNENEDDDAADEPSAVPAAWWGTAAAGTRPDAIPAVRRAVAIRSSRQGPTDVPTTTAQLPAGEPKGVVGSI